MEQPLEIEVKYLVRDKDLIREKLLKAGYKSNGRNFETNLRFEDKDLNLIKEKKLLRLRKDAKTKLTFKSKPSIKDSGFKIHNELEVEVSDFNTMESILSAIGFHVEQTYEKWRETFIAGNAEICIDEMPYGCFLEIEGDKSDILTISRTLGFTHNKSITANYLAIFAEIKKQTGLNFSDVTFENFKDLKIDFYSIISSFEGSAKQTG